jgi:hypothetical protein
MSASETWITTRIETMLALAACLGAFLLLANPAKSDEIPGEPTPAPAEQPSAQPTAQPPAQAPPAAKAEGSKATPSTVPPDDVCRKTKPPGPCDMDHHRPEHGSLGNIGASISNPTSDLWQVSMSFQALQFFDGDANAGDPKLGSNVNLQPVMPFPVYGEGKDQWKLVTRPIIPIIFNQPIPMGSDRFKNRGGIGDIQLPLLLNPPVSLLGNFIFGAGPVFEFPSSTNDLLGNQQYAVGPALVAGYHNKLLVAGVFPNYFFGYADRGDRKSSTRTTSKLSLLYFLNINLPNAWQIGMNPTISYNDKALKGDKWTVPIGIYGGKTIKVGGMPVNIKLGLEYSVVSPDTFGKRAQIRLQVTPVVPGLVQSPIFGGR